jgi:phosphoribosylamine--glycine ligase/phosphoribosylformylglycinamidine cyclo-ligase
VEISSSKIAKIPCFAPSKEAAQIEGSKAFSKDFMARHGIPTAEYRNFTDFESACQYVNSISHKVILKVSSHAAGKGVIIPETKEETLKALKTIMVDHQFGFAGDVVVIEEFLDGDELSILTFSDGMKFKSMPPAQVHKRIFDGDTGPNTGGMGCYAPTKITPPSVLKDIDELIVRPTFEGLRQEGKPSSSRIE